MQIGKIKKELEFEALVLPAFILFTIFSIIPILGSVVYSFTNWDGLSKNVSFIGLENYINLFKDKEMVLPAIRNSMFFALANTVIVTLIAIPLALAFDSKLKSKKLLRAVFFFPSVPSALVIGYMFSYILAPTDYGPVNMFLSFFGVKPINWLGDVVLANVTILLVTLWTFAGWHAMIYLANLQTISAEYYESAKIDGANAFQCFRSITLPMLTPAFSTSCLFSLVISFKLYDLPFALTGGGPGYASYYIVQTIIEKGIRQNYYGLANALSVVLLILVLGASLVQQGFMQRREDKLYE